MIAILALLSLLATLVGGPWLQVAQQSGPNGPGQQSPAGGGPAPQPAPTGLQMNARAGLDGIARVGAWVPVEVEFTNQGDDVEGEVQVRVEDARRQGVYGRAPTVYTLPVSLPPRSHKRLLMDVLFPSDTNQLKATLVSNGKELVTQDISVTRAALGDFICGVISRDPQAFDFLPSLDLNGPQRRVRLARLDPVEVPDRAQLLSSLDCLILSNAQSSSLRPEQLEALRVWVGAGGLLIAVGGPTWQKTLAPLPDDLLAAHPTELATVDRLDGLVELTGQAPTHPGPWLISRGRASGTVVAQQDGIPLIVGRKQGQGTIFYLAFDPSSQALGSWPGQPFIWRYLLAHASVDTGVGSTLARPYMRWGRLPRAALGDFDSLPEPDFNWAVWGLLLYALIIGPVCFLFLRRVDRPLLALLTVPGLALGTSALFVLLVAAEREGDLAATKATVIRGVGSLAFSRTYVSVFARHGGTFDVNVPPGGLLFGLYYPFPMRSYTDTPDWALRVAEGADVRVDSLTMNDGSLATFAVDQQFNLNGQVDTALVADHDQIVGTVTNHLGQPLRSAALLLDMQSVYPLGDLEPGESRTVSITLPERAAIGYGVPTGLASQIYPGWNAARPEDSSRRDLLESIFSSRYYAARMDMSGTTLVGWLAHNPTSLDVNGTPLASVEYTLFVSSIPVSFPDHYEGELRPSLLARQHLTVAPVGQQDFGSYTLAPGESVSLQFTLPDRPERLEVQSLTVNLEGQPSGQSTVLTNGVGHLSLFDWRAAAWRDWEAHFGGTRLDDPQRFISAGGDIRVKYTFDPPPNSNLTQIRLTRFDISGQVRAP